MDPTTDDDRKFEALLQAPLLDPPDDFAARVLTALPPRPRRWRLTAPAGWPAIPAVLTAAFAALGATQVLLFVGGLWATTTLGAG